jgi:hypothetical protein
MSDVEIRFADLQSRYTELLEKRIAQLEAAIAAPVIIPTPVAAAANGVEKEDDNDSCDDEKTKKDVCYQPPASPPPSKFHQLMLSTESR